MKGNLSRSQIEPVVSRLDTSKEVCMKAGMVLVGVLLLSGCSLNLKHSQVEEKPVNHYQKIHHTITFDTEPACVGSCLTANK